MSPWAHHQFLVAAKAIGPFVNKEACKAAVAQYAWCLLTPQAMVEWVLNMRSPKNAFPQASELISLQQLRYRSTVTWPNLNYDIRPLCTCNALDIKWKELLTPLRLNPPTSTTHPLATAVVWPHGLLDAVMFSRLALIRNVDKSFLLTFLVRGVPCGGQFLGGNDQSTADVAAGWWAGLRRWIVRVMCHHDPRVAAVPWLPMQLQGGGGGADGSRSYPPCQA